MTNNAITERKLAAIMFTDMVGYSGLMQRNEGLAIELLEEQKQLLRSKFAEFSGQEVNCPGDGFVVEFASALEATRFAVAIQKAIAERNATQPTNRRFRIRVGIHIGDVVHRNGTVLGDAVNIAARIEPLADPGGICVTRPVHNEVANKIELQLNPLGRKDLKNIQQPWEVYRVALPWLVSPAPWSLRAQLSRSPVVFMMGLTIGFFLASLGATLLIRKSPQELPRSCFTFEAPEPLRFDQLSSPAVSPDGQRVAFSARATNGQRFLCVRDVAQEIPRTLDGTQDATNPFWSPDGQSIAFFAEGKLKTIGIQSTVPRTLCAVQIPGGLASGSWGSRGEIVFTPGSYTNLAQIRESGGDVSPATQLDRVRGDLAHYAPVFLPDGRHFLFTARGADDSYIAAALINSTNRSVVSAHMKGSVAFAPPGWLLFSQESALVAQRFDTDRLRLTGDPKEIGARVYGAFSPTFFSASTSVLAWFPAVTNLPTRLTWFSRAGEKLLTLGSPGNYVHLDLSPDDRTVVLLKLGEDNRTPHMWSMDTKRDTSSPLASDKLAEWPWHPVWSPDGRSIVFSARAQGDLFDIYRVRLEDSGRSEALFRAKGLQWLWDYSPDARFLLYGQDGFSWCSDLYALPMKDGQPGESIAFPEPGFKKALAQFSPNGNWVAYVSQETEREEVFVRPFPERGSKVQVSVKGGTQPRWSRNSEELFYIAPDFQLMALRNKGTNQFDPTEPVALFRAPVDTVTRIDSYRSLHQFAVARDGRFLFNALAGDAKPPLMNVVVNWTAELKR